jgi:hypothetical protein
VRLLPRKAILPAEVAQALELGPGDRLLAWSSLVGGGAAAATVRDLRIVTPRGKRMVHSWVDVDHAVWEQDSRMLVIWWVGSRRTTPLEIHDDVGRLPEVIRERVQSSVVLTAPVPLADGRAARVALRRNADGELVAQSLVPPGVRADAPDVAPRLERAIEALWTDAGHLNYGAPPGIG